MNKKYNPDDPAIIVDHIEARATNKKLDEASELEKRAKKLEEKAKYEVPLLRSKATDARKNAERTGEEARAEHLAKDENARLEQERSLQMKMDREKRRQEMAGIRIEAIAKAEAEKLVRLKEAFKDASISLEKLLNMLSKKEEFLLRKRLGFEDVEKLTLEEIADEVSLTVEEVEKTTNDALKKFDLPSGEKGLKKLIDSKK